VRRTVSATTIHHLFPSPGNAERGNVAARFRRTDSSPPGCCGLRSRLRPHIFFARELRSVLTLYCDGAGAAVKDPRASATFFFVLHTDPSASSSRGLVPQSGRAAFQIGDASERTSSVPIGLFGGTVYYRRILPFLPGPSSMGGRRKSPGVTDPASDGLLTHTQVEMNLMARQGASCSIGTTFPSSNTVPVHIRRLSKCKSPFRWAGLGP